MACEKGQIRKIMLAMRGSQDRLETARKSLLAEHNLFSDTRFRGLSPVMLYVSNDSEVQTGGIIRKCLGEGREVAVPSVVRGEKRMFPSLIKTLSELEEGMFGIKEPAKRFLRPIPPDALKAVIVPGVAFDRKGGRIGFGGGYYDRFLEKVPAETYVCALAFDFQVVGTLPLEPGDFPVRTIITETRVIDCYREDNNCLEM